MAGVFALNLRQYCFLVLLQSCKHLFPARDSKGGSNILVVLLVIFVPDHEHMYRVAALSNDDNLKAFSHDNQIPHQIGAGRASLERLLHVAVDIATTSRPASFYFEVRVIQTLPRRPSRYRHEEVQRKMHHSC